MDTQYAWNWEKRAFATILISKSKLLDDREPNGKQKHKLHEGTRANEKTKTKEKNWKQKMEIWLCFFYGHVYVYVCGTAIRFDYVKYHLNYVCYGLNVGEISVSEGG